MFVVDISKWVWENHSDDDWKIYEKKLPKVWIHHIRTQENVQQEECSNLYVDLRKNLYALFRYLKFHYSYYIWIFNFSSKRDFILKLLRLLVIEIQIVSVVYCLHICIQLNIFLFYLKNVQTRHFIGTRLRSMYRT